MAEGFVNAHSLNNATARSAGTSPAGFINKGAISVMKKKGIDISVQESKEITKEMIAWATDLVTMGCCRAGDLCDVYLKDCGSGCGVKKIDWEIKDPLGKSEAVMESVALEIEEKIKSLVGEVS
ncbi:MAG: arsenate reductase ArsC [Deltaproteobacteria bacterium]|nr:arsenate reductase ArsC [Deltaproteobacteria bacterium]